ncbi:MAG: shikimate kinase [Dysgonamonadaceae bacterium]|nr:shikimate kinase [Dysgonamonadaceae bacterium]
MMRIFIVGYMGVGKTTIGKSLGKLLNVEFIDLDKYIENKYRKTIAELFEEKGEDGFRAVERRALEEVAAFENVIVSTGGGAPCFFDNMEKMNAAGITVYIEAEPEELADRLLASKTVRPLIAGKSREELVPFIAQHLSARERYYKQARIVHKTDKLLTKKEVHLTVDGIAEKLKNITK